MQDFYIKTPSIRRAVNTLHRGGVIAYPTEAVWGLGCDPFDEEAVNKILRLKQRHVDKGLILIASDIRHFDFLLDGLSTEQQQQLASRWPGPVTWIVPHQHKIPHWVSGKHAGVALRVSAHPYVRALCQYYGGAIVSTSANPQGKPEARTRWQVQRYFGSSPLLDFSTQGVVGKQQQPSTIIDLLSGKVLR